MPSFCLLNLRTSGFGLVLLSFSVCWCFVEPGEREQTNGEIIVINTHKMQKQWSVENGHETKITNWQIHCADCHWAETVMLLMIMVKRTWINRCNVSLWQNHVRAYKINVQAMAVWYKMFCCAFSLKHLTREKKQSFRFSYRTDDCYSIFNEIINTHNYLIDCSDFGVTSTKTSPEQSSVTIISKKKSTSRKIRFVDFVCVCGKMEFIVLNVRDRRI